MGVRVEAVAVRNCQVDVVGPATMWDLTGDEFEAGQVGVLVLPGTADGLVGTDGALLFGDRDELIAWFEQQAARLRVRPPVVLEGQAVHDPLYDMLRALPAADGGAAG